MGGVARLQPKRRPVERSTIICRMGAWSATLGNVSRSLNSAVGILAIPDCLHVWAAQGNIYHSYGVKLSQVSIVARPRPLSWLHCF